MAILSSNETCVCKLNRKVIEMNMNRRLLRVSLAVVIILIPATLMAAAPEGHKVITVEQDAVMFLQELGALIIQDGETISFDFVAPTDNRSEEYRSVDIESGDIIMMVNGKRVKSMKDLKTQYEDAVIGEDIKFGIKRDKKMMIVAFQKADPENAPKQQMMMVTMDDDGEGTVSTTSESGTQVIKMEAGSPGNITLLDLGLLLGEDDDKLIVTNILPHASKILGDVEVSEGDIIKSIQGKSVTSLDKFAELYESIPVGESVSLIFLHDSKEVSVSFTRPDTQKNMMIEREL